MLLALSAAVMALEWQEVDHGFKAVVINDLITVGEYQIASVEGISQLYRRKKGEQEWEKVYDGHRINKRGDYDRDYSLIYYNSMLFGARTNSNTGDFDVVSHDSGKTWDTLSDVEDDILMDIDDDIINRDTLVEIGWNGKSVQACIDLSDGYYTIYPTGDMEVNTVKLHDGAFYIGLWGLICKVTNFGDTMKPLEKGLPERTAIRDILVQDSLNLYASTDEGVYRSVDGGENWNAVDLQFSAADFSVLEQLTFCDSTVFGMSKNRVFCLSPSDDHFTEIIFPVYNNFDRVKLSSFHNKLCIGGYDGVYEYDAGSGEVTLINSGLERLSRIASLTATDANVYATTYSVGGYCLLLKTTDRNTYWDTLFIAKCSSFDFGENDNYLRLSYESQGEEIYYYSNDYGASWEKRKNMLNPLFNGEIIDRENDTLYHKRGYEDNQLLEYSINQGLTWDTLLTFDDSDIKFLCKSGKRMFFTGMVFPPNQKGYKILHYSDDNGKTNTSFNDPLRSMPTMAKASNGTLLVGGYRKAAYSIDNGSNWTCFDTIPISGVMSLYDSTAIGYNIYSMGKYHSARNYYFYSVNYGETWSSFPTTLGDGKLSNFFTGANIVRNSSTIYCVEAGCLYTIAASELTGATSIVLPKSSKNNGQSLFSANLSTNSIYLKLYLNRSERYTARLYTPSGRLVQSTEGVAVHNGEAIRLDHQGLSRGYYILQVCGERRKESVPILLK